MFLMFNPLAPPKEEEEWRDWAQMKRVPRRGFSPDQMVLDHRVEMATRSKRDDPEAYWEAFEQAMSEVWMQILETYPGYTGDFYALVGMDLKDNTPYMKILVYKEF